MKNENTKEAKQLTDEEIEAVAGGIKVAPDEQTGFWRWLADFFNKKKT